VTINTALGLAHCTRLAREPDRQTVALSWGRLRRRLAEGEAMTRERLVNLSIWLAATIVIVLMLAILFGGIRL